MRIIIPAGGRGSRLRPITDFRPKPLLPLGDRPILTRIVDQIPEELPITVVVTSDVEAAYREWHATQVADRDVEIYVESSSKGLVGPVAAIAECVERQAICEDLVVMMGDSLPTVNVPDFVKDAGNQPRIVVHRLPPDQDARRFGVVEIGKEGAIVSFEEKPDFPRSAWVFTGCLLYPKGLLSKLSGIASSCPPQMGSLVKAFLDLGEQVGVYHLAGEWNDVGTVDAYFEAHRRFAVDNDHAAAETLGNRLAGTVFVDSNASVNNSSIRNTLIFSNARVSDSDLTGCVVWPGSVVEGRRIVNKLIVDRGEYALQHAKGTVIGA